MLHTDKFIEACHEDRHAPAFIESFKAGERSRSGMEELILRKFHHLIRESCFHKHRRSISEINFIASLDAVLDIIRQLVEELVCSSQLIELDMHVTRIAKNESYFSSSIILRRDIFHFIGYLLAAARTFAFELSTLPFIVHSLCKRL